MLIFVARENGHRRVADAARSRQRANRRVLECIGGAEEISGNRKKDKWYMIINKLEIWRKWYVNEISRVVIKG